MGKIRSPNGICGTPVMHSVAAMLHHQSSHPFVSKGAKCPLGEQIQLVSVTAAGAALLPDISLSESAAQRLERAITTRATVLTTLRTTGRCVLTMSRTLDIGKVQNEHSHGARSVKPSRLKRVRSIESNSKRFRRLLINQKESVDETDR